MVLDKKLVLEELEEALIMSDVGVKTATEIVSKLRDKVKKDIYVGIFLSCFF